jgi:KaiC
MFIPVGRESCWPLPTHTRGSEGGIRKLSDSRRIIGLLPNNRPRVALQLHSDDVSRPFPKRDQAMERISLPMLPTSTAPTKVVLRMTAHPQLFKAATGIDGLDAIMEGGLPAGRPTLLCGAAGCGKTLFGVTFLVEGALRFDQAGVLMTFEERPEDISANVESLGYKLPDLIEAKKLLIDQVKIEQGFICRFKRLYKARRYCPLATS